MSPSSVSKGEKLAQRVSRILARLHEGEAIDKNQLAQEFEVDVRTIERDLGERLRGLVERNASGCWQLVHSARGTIPARYLDHYARMSGTGKLFPDMSLDYLLPQLGLADAQRGTKVQGVAQEDLDDPQSFEALQQAIKQFRFCRFRYKGKPRDAQPYQLIHSNGVWYLAAEEAGQLKIFSMSLLEHLQIDQQRHFKPNPAHIEYIESQGDVWFTPQTTEVLLRVAPEVAYYFTRRQLLPRQRQREDSDGSLLVTTHINHLNQLLPVVRYWLPNVRIVQPLQWHDALVAQLMQSLELWAPGSVHRDIKE